MADAVYRIAVTSIVRRYNPLSKWGVRCVRRKEVLVAAREGRVDSRPSDRVLDIDRYDEEGWRQYHIARTAWLVLHPDVAPIELDVGCPHLGYSIPGGFLVADGHHRLAAAMLRGDAYIQATFGGEVRQFHGLFPHAARAASRAIQAAAA